MRVISIIVRLVALFDPALHKSTEEEEHPSLLHKRGVNFASLLLLSSPFFRDVFHHLQQVEGDGRYTLAWKASVGFA